MMMIQFDADKIDWAKVDGMIPAIVQDATSLRVLMLGYMNKEALAATLQSGFVTFFSRTRQQLWQKGETSGNTLTVRDMRLDCDQDTLLFLVDAKGPTCHTGTRSCFGDTEKAADLSLLADLGAVIRDRHANPAEGSYTASLFAAGTARMAQKVGEEGVEVALAAATQSPALAEEAADLLYHLLVLLESCALSLTDVLQVLAARRK